MEQANNPNAARGGPSSRIRKPRGRPPVNTQDETPADRRRTQIRQAQRAYRQRKDDKITTLQKKVERLQAVAKDMSDSFLQFSDRAMASSALALRPKLESELRATAATLAALCDAATAANSDNSLDEDGSAPPLPHQPALAGRTYQPIAPSSSSSDKKPQDAGSPQALPFGYVITYESSDDDNAGEGPSDQQPSLTRALQPPYTYSFRETAFANRLYRACIERGVHILSAVHLRPSEYQRAYRICRHFCTREELIALFRKALGKPVMEPFSQLKLCLGGAGTHFPREEDRSNKALPETSSNYTSNTRAILAAWGLRLTPDLEADLHHYEGIWYDSEDVAGYLEHLGAKIDAGGSLAKVETETLKIEGILPDQGQASRPVGTARHQDAPRTVSHGADEDGGVTVAGVRPDVTIQITNELGEEQWDRFCDFSTPWLMDPALFDTTPMASGGELLGQGEVPRMATIDLSILVNKLIKCSVCVGRGPGFRREDVNTALRAAIIEA